MLSIKENVWLVLCFIIPPMGETLLKSSGATYYRTSFTFGTRYEENNIPFIFICLRGM